MDKKAWLDYENKYCDRDVELLKRSYNILMENVYDKEGFLWSPYRCISPGKNNFQGIWNWDSAFHAVGVSRWNTEVAKENIIGFLKFQKENGMLPDVVRENGFIEDSLSKPPVFAWAAEIVYKRDKDIEFLKEIYPKLVLNAEWWENDRSNDGLFYYDASYPERDDYLQRVKWESGWDNSVRWDNGITEYWAIDLNCFMVMCYNSLEFIAKELGNDADAVKWNSKSQVLSNLINEKMWNKSGKYYSDTNRFTGEISNILSPASFMPLFVGIANNEQAEYMREIAENKYKFNGKMPTVSFDNPQYSLDYWRGPTWLNVAYFAAKGLKYYNFEVGNKIKENILNMCYQNKDGIYENYDSITGKGLCCNHFSWSCVFIIEFILNFND